MASLAPTFGRGAMTNSWTDIKNTDLVVIMGGNAAEAHPCGFKWVTEAKANRGAKLIVVDPRFTRSASVADIYAPIRQGTDIAFLLGVINYCIQNDKVQWEYTKIVHQRALHRQGRLRLSGRPVHRLRRSQARLQSSRPGNTSSAPMVSSRPTPRWNIRAASGSSLKKHVSVYTPEMVERICGTPKDKFLKIAADDRRDLVADQDDDVDVRARLDPALQGFAEHPLHGDVAAHSRQHRRARRRHECLARSLQHPGTDRSRPDVEPDPRLSDDPDGKGSHVRHLYVDARLQAVAARPDELLAELQEVLRQLPEVDVGRRRRRPRTTLPTTICPSSTCRATTCCAPSS